MSAVPHFLAAMDRLRHVSDAGPTSLLTRSAIAVADSLPGVEGAGICLSRDLGVRVAVGVSDHHTLLAEQLEFTAGFGPGLQARRTGQPIVAGASFARRYAAFHDGLVGSTGFRAVCAVPLVDDVVGDPPAVLLLYYTSTAMVDRPDGTAFTDIMQLALLLGHTVSVAATELTTQLQAPPAADEPEHVRRRLSVEHAVRMLMATHGFAPRDALDILRAYAYARGNLVDDIAQDLVTHRLATDAFR